MLRKIQWWLSKELIKLGSIKWYQIFAVENKREI